MAEMGRVLKSLGRIVPAEILEAGQQATVQAAAVVGAANARAARLLAEVEALREEARRQGFEAGRAAAEVRFTQTLLAAGAEAERVRAEAQPAALRLASKMAEKIVGRAVDLDPAVLVEIAGQALQASRARAGVVKLRIHPEDLAILQGDQARARLMARIGAAAELQLCPDAAVGRYGCLVETSAGRLDARLATQLAALEQALLGEPAHG
jgi:flagellar biosynthesis/type III secretory pathway protein FliH